MSQSQGIPAPNFLSFKNLVRSRGVPIENSQAQLVSLLKRRQISGSRQCAEATALLLRRVVEAHRAGDPRTLISNVKQVGQSLIDAQPREATIGNIVRRVLGLIRDEIEEDRSTNDSPRKDESENSASGEDAVDRRSLHRGASGQRFTTPSPMRNDLAGLLRSQSSTTANKGAFSLLPRPTTNADMKNATSSPAQLPKGDSTPKPTKSDRDAARDLKAEVVEGILEIIDEIKQAEEQIAGYALEHIGSNEVILTQSMTETVQKFLLKAATKRKFTLFCAEGYPNDLEQTYVMATGRKEKLANDNSVERSQKSLSAAGITVTIIPDAAVFAVMSRVTKVVLDAHVVNSDGSVVAACGSQPIALAAKYHRVPVVVLGGVYKISPLYPSNVSSYLDDDDPAKIYPNERGISKSVKLVNPSWDFVGPELLDICITNIGAQAPTNLYRIMAEHYRAEDIEL